MMNRPRELNGVSQAPADHANGTAGGTTRVLIVEDEHDIAALIKHTLEPSGDIQASIVGSGDVALRSIAERPPDLIILDLNLPVVSGTEVCRILRARPETAHLPVIMLTARTTESDRVTGLDLGADDYVTKPFSLRELSARVRAVLRRRLSFAPKGAVYRGERLVGDFDAVAVSVDDEPVRLTRREFELLRFLVENKNRVLSRDRLLEGVWGYDRFIESRSVDVHVGRLRPGWGRWGPRLRPWWGWATASWTDQAQPPSSSFETSASMRIRARSSRCQSRFGRHGRAGCRPPPGLPSLRRGSPGW
jgi:DNA-binding response OmpR family regulator